MVKYNKMTFFIRSALSLGQVLLRIHLDFGLHQSFKPRSQTHPQLLDHHKARFESQKSQLLLEFKTQYRPHKAK